MKPAKSHAKIYIANKKRYAPIMECTVFLGKIALEYYPGHFMYDLSCINYLEGRMSTPLAASAVGFSPK